ncbi:MAG: adenylate/guanylate cyclase domain-containing protein, partial [Pseudomonadota bacterium]|nr:adenylate/guanylate cyclase domain-containing protein [Pseudomonadota bacterium]
YIYELILLWPGRAWYQSILLLIVWIHGCIGLHFWLRLTPWYRRAAPVLLALAVLIPAAAIAGFTVSAREAAAAVEDPDTLNAIKSFTNWPDAEEFTRLIAWSDYAKYGFYGILAAVLCVLAVRLAMAAGRGGIPITYVPRPTVKGMPGATLLEISRMNGIPHLSVCGGRARCSTCRVELVSGGKDIPPPTGAEAETLRSIGAAPGVRLACQLRPEKPIAVNLLLRADRSHGSAGGGVGSGVERNLAVLFMDIRGFTSMSEKKLPYDVVYVLNRMFGAAGKAIRDEDGWIDKYMGDGLMAVFGRDSGAADGCRQALRAAAAIDVAIDEVNRELGSEIPSPLRIGMGLHVGPLVLGHIGYADSAAMTVIGRTVNAASRFEAATKELKCQFVVSAEAARMAGLGTKGLRSESIAVRGLSEPVNVFPFERARDVPAPKKGPAPRQKPAPKAPPGPG